MHMTVSKLQEIVEERGAWHATVHGVAKVRCGLETEKQQKSNILQMQNIMNFDTWICLDSHHLN